jgi:hypothetical protein
LQVLFGLNQLLNVFEKSSNNDSLDPLFDSFLNTIKSLDKGEESLSPLDFILRLRTKLPIYAEKDKYGMYAQHDVHEFWSTLVSHFGANNAKLSQATNIILEKKY